MIREAQDPGGLGRPGRSRPAAPWEDAGGLEELACAVLWTSGPEVGRDAPFRVLAVRRAPRTGAAAPAWERLERWCDPFAGAGPGGDPEQEPGGRAASARMAREYGVHRGDLAGAVPPGAALAELAAFVAGRPLLVLDAQAFGAWLPREGARPRRVLGLTDAALLLAPGRLASRGEALPRLLLGRTLAHGPGGPDEGGSRGAPRALAPEDLLAAWAVLVGRTLALEPATLALLAHGAAEAWRQLAAEDEERAAALALLLALCEHPSAWRPAAAGLFPEHPELALLEDGCLSRAARELPRLDDALEEALPSWAQSAKAERRTETLSGVADEERVLDADDRRTVDEIFGVHLPRLFAERDGGPPATPRLGQAQVAARVAERFGRHELQLIHAPTGTGKTLAYLVPTALWALRNAVRVGVATFTRALQEQAMERDVPLALEVLRRAGVAGPIRVALLKGRPNYLCWRALRLQAPAPAARGRQLESLAWTSLALFGLTDPDGDLDRFPRRPPLGLGQAWSAALDRLLRQARAESGCCSLSADRDACAAEAARRRAERSHVVITNHAFALARREFFRHVVFDECEHLHDVAHGAFSHAVPVRALRDLLARLWRPGSTGRQPLNRVVALAVEGSPAQEAAQDAIAAAETAALALDRLAEATLRFKLWREEVAGGRNEHDLHSLFREYVLEHDATDLLRAHEALHDALGEVGVQLAGLAEHLDTLPTRGIQRLRRTLDLLRAELDERLAGVAAWLPRGDGGQPAFRPETFYDLETTPRGEDVLAARVLLPHEFLGRHYYPELASATFLSATTWLKDGFEAAATYLGLARAAHPLGGEERFACALSTFRAPETFDYRRVLVAVPRDAPAVGAGKLAYLDYVARFVAHLAERTRGRLLVLFTNAEDLAWTAARVGPFLRERGIPFWYQRMEEAAKEELSELFRGTPDSVLFGLDTFWYGADFPGSTLEYLVLVRLPYGVPDRYHHAQCAALGAAEQRRQVYMPRSLAKFRQGFGRLMRKESDRGCVFVLDARILDPRHRSFLRELPLRRAFDDAPTDEPLARLVTADTDRCLHEALAHMEMLADVERRGLARPFAGWRLDAPRPAAGPAGRDGPEPDLVS